MKPVLVGRRGTETGHFADDGNPAPDARELSLTTFNGKKCKQTIKAHDRGFRDGPGSSGAGLKRPGPDERERYFPITEYSLQNQPITHSQRFSSSSNTFLLDKNPAIKMEGSNIMNPGSKRHFRSSR